MNFYLLFEGEEIFLMTLSAGEVGEGFLVFLLKDFYEEPVKSHLERHLWELSW
jgi:hypothetical protein